MGTFHTRESTCSSQRVRSTLERTEQDVRPMKVHFPVSMPPFRRFAGSPQCESFLLVWFPAAIRDVNFDSIVWKFVRVPSFRSMCVGSKIYYFWLVSYCMILYKWYCLLFYMLIQMNRNFFYIGIRKLG